jgi:hypothetical protein
VACLQGRTDRVEGVGQGSRQLLLVQVLGAGLDVVSVGLQPFVIIRVIP